MGFNLKKSLKKLGKNLKKVAKFSVAANPLIPGSKSSKLVSTGSKALLPVAAGAAGASLFSKMGSFGKSVAGIAQTVGDTAGSLSGAVDQVTGVLDSFGGESSGGGGGAPAPSGVDATTAQPKSWVMPAVLIGGGLLVAYLAFRKR